MRMGRRGGIRNELDGVDEEEHEESGLVEEALEDYKTKMVGKKMDKEI